MLRSSGLWNIRGKTAENINYREIGYTKALRLEQIGELGELKHPSICAAEGVA